MSTPSEPEQALVQAAIALWEPLAARAWRYYASRGRGVLLLGAAELLEEASRQRRGLGTGLEPGFVSAEDVPRGDDFRPLLVGYDPARQVVLLVQRADGEETLLTLTSDETARPDPETCYRRLEG